eukprot:TRINITY_DN523_c0_g1_i13.p1 TRINITY_DN523_c0_g1~~TRINITY_DN523_c0_g1_i13.p1  ORF type:complete len:569 (+),score=122.32 TRINITY_DN523_c0_g1_i13:61-1767(+)
MQVMASAMTAAALAATQPNFVIMMADDMGYGDWSRTGSPAKTPELDEWSRSENAVWFKRAYSGNPICSPTRASVMSGRTPARTCIYSVEQHILCRGGTQDEHGGCIRGEYSLANATREAGYISGFYGKWHLGSLRNETSDCYPAPQNGKCNSGYVSVGTSCCQGLDGHLPISNPHHFGFDEFVATPQCGAGGTTNCGCFFYPKPHNDTACNVGHYFDSCSTCNMHLECAQYFHGLPDMTIQQWPTVSGDDDEDFLVSRFSDLVDRSLSEKKPFLAVIFFHGVHIPYVATAESRALYPNATENEQDYWGGLTQISKAVGRVRSILKEKNLSDNTWVSLTADNGPEVDNMAGQGTSKGFPNPGRTDGLRGRKRDTSEGGIREIGIVEYPPVIKANRVEETFPIATMDLLPTVLDLLGKSSYEGRALDGTSLIPHLSGKQDERPQEAGLGWHGVFVYGDTRGPNGTIPCPSTSASQSLGDVPANFTTVGNQPQFAWAEGNHMKMFGCHPKGTKTWNFFLYNLTSDRAETTDLWEAQRDFAKAMFGRFEAWQQSVWASQGPDELGCNIPKEN